MAGYDVKNNSLTVKVVFYGPPLSGKTTNLMRLHDLTGAGAGDMTTLDSSKDRTSFLDLLPISRNAPSGLRIVVKLFSVPGGGDRDGSWKTALSHADGVLFVADSQHNQATANAIAFDNLMRDMETVGLDAHALPIVIQFNKRDLADVASEEEIRARWAGAPWPVVFASALIGDGVQENVALLLAKIYRSLDARFALRRKHGIGCREFLHAGGTALELAGTSF